MLDPLIKEKILNCIKENNLGCSSTEISKRLKLNRVTVTKYLSVIYSEGLINYKNLGMAKSWHMERNYIIETFKGNNGAHVKNVLDFIGNGVIVVDNDLKIVWSNKTVRSWINNISNLDGNYLHDVFWEKESKEECASKLALKECKTFKTNYEITNTDGKKQKLKVTLSPILNSNNDAVGVIQLLEIN